MWIYCQTSLLIWFRKSSSSLWRIEFFSLTAFFFINLWNSTSFMRLSSGQNCIAMGTFFSQEHECFFFVFFVRVDELKKEKRSYDSLLYETKSFFFRDNSVAIQIGQYKVTPTPLQTTKRAFYFLRKSRGYFLLGTSARVLRKRVMRSTWL